MEKKQEMPRETGHSDSDLVLLGVMDIKDGERLRSHMAAKEVAVTLLHNKATCRSGCATTVEVWCRTFQVQAVMQYLGDERNRLLADLDFDPELVGQVYDPEQAEATCPACGHRFSTAHTQCPDCGLQFA